MSAEALQPAQFPQRLFHGSVSELRGDHLQPGGGLGASGGQDEWKHLGQSKNDYVSASERENTAWDFAHKASGQLLGNTPRPRVYEVEPNAQTKMGVEHADSPHMRRAWDEDWYRKPQPAAEWVSPQFKVTAQHDTRPGSQGTFPSIDWRKHVDPRKKNASGALWANHPHHSNPEYVTHQHEAYREQMTRRIAERQGARETKAAQRPEDRLF